MKKRSGRPSVSVTACGLVFMPPLVQPIKRPLLSLDHPFFDRRLVAVWCAFIYVASIITVFGTAASAAMPSIILSKTPLLLHRFHLF